MNNKKHVKTAFVTLISIIVTLYMLIHLWVISGKMSFSEIAHWFFGNSDSSNGELLKIILNFIGGLAVFYGLYLTLRRSKAMERSVDKQSEQIELTRMAQTDERFKNAIEHLSSEKNAIVIGGIAELHQIALSENLKYASVVSEIFCDYIRRTTCVYKYNPEEIDSSVIQIIIEYLFPNFNENNGPYYQLKKKLRASDLSSVKLMTKNVSNTCFDYVKMPDCSSTYFGNSTFHHSVFSNKLIEKVVFEKCEFYRSLFDSCSVYYLSFINNQIWRATNFIDSEIDYLDMKNCNIYQAQMYSCEFRNSEIIDSSIQASSFVATNIFGLKVRSDSKTFQGSQFIGSNLQKVQINCDATSLVFYSCLSDASNFAPDELSSMLEEHVGKGNDLSQVSFTASHSHLKTNAVLDLGLCKKLERNYEMFKRQLLYSKQHKILDAN